MGPEDEEYEEYEEYEFDSEGNKKWEDPGELERINERENEKAWDEAMRWREDES